VPTGIALRHAAEQLFDAAERVLLRDEPSALTSRAVTTEALMEEGLIGESHLLLTPVAIGCRAAPL